MTEPLVDAMKDVAREVARGAIDDIAQRLFDRLEELIENDPSQLLTTTQLAEICPAYSSGALLKLAERARRNGLAESGALSRQGKKLLWNKRRFMAWAEGR